MFISVLILVVGLLVALSPGPAHGQNEVGAGGSDAKPTYKLPVGVVLKDGDTFEYIVVGAGAAGSAAAARLALAGFKVLLLEAGGDPGLLSKIPSAAMGLLGSNVDWQYPTLSNNVSCQASRDGACRFSRGKCLGGSTSINYMLYTRGNRKDYDFGIPGWSWKDLKPYFLRYEGLQVLDELPRSSIPYHNTSGILKLEFFDDPQNKWQSRIYEGYQQLGFPENRDVNGVSQIGVSRVYGYVYEGERMSTARAYLANEEVKSKLMVATETLCTGAIIDTNNVTRGVTVLPKGAITQLKLFATKEVILSAGTIGTPQILMLSGVGPAEHLNEMGIPVRKNLPVGDNMSDHVLPLVILLVDSGLKPLKDIGGLLETVGEAVEYGLASDGPLASNGLTDINLFANTACYDPEQRRWENTSPNCSLSTLQVIHSYVDRNTIPLAKPVFQQAVNLNDAVVDQLAAANIDNAFIIISPIVLQPFSRGHIRLASADPTKPPAIYANYLSDERDVDEMIRAIKILEQLVETSEFKKRNAKLLRLEFPGCPRDGEPYWRCYVRQMTYAVFHAVGTCSLSRVVDTELRVKGIERLRVADASVFPRIPRGNTEAPTVAVGERLVDFITRKPRRKCH